MSERDQGRKFRRKLTPFLAHQMLYDYATGHLDMDRKVAVDEFLEKDQESQAILASIRAALVYAESLSTTKIDPEALHHLLDAESPASLGKRYSSWEEWPEPIRWSLTAIAISVMVATSVALIPWNKLHRSPTKTEDSIEVAQITKPVGADAEAPGAVAEPKGSGDEPDDAAEAAANENGDEGSGDDIGDAGDDSGTKAAAAVKEAPTPKPTPTPAPTPVPKSTPSKAPVVVAATAHPDAANDEGSENMVAGKAKGFVYRAFMNLSDLEELGPKITEDIRALGGEKAGEVELGWKRGTGRYYHFALPEENEKRLLEKLQVYGPVRISKDPHPRVMPPGKVRFILWVESSS